MYILYSSKTAQKIDVIIHNFFRLLISKFEILLEKSKSMGENPDSALTGD